MADRPRLSTLDEIKAGLQGRHPGWRIWFVPYSVAKGVTWCAQRLPLLNEGTPGELEQAIAEAGAEHLTEAQAVGRLAPERESSQLPADGRAAR